MILCEHMTDEEQDALEAEPVWVRMWEEDVPTPEEVYVGHVPWGLPEARSGSVDLLC